MELKYIEGTENNCPVLKGVNWRLELFRCYYFQMLINGLTIQSRLNFESEILSAHEEGIDSQLITFCHVISSFREDKNLLIELLEDEESVKVLLEFVNESLNYYSIRNGQLEEYLFDVPPDIPEDYNDEFFRNVLDAYNARYVITREGFMFITDPKFKETVEYLGVDYEEARELFLRRDMKEVGVKSNDNLWVRKILEVNGVLEAKKVDEEEVANRK